MKSLADAVFPAEVFSLPLFHGISETGRAALDFNAGGCGRVRLRKTRSIYHMGDRVSELGLCCPARFRGEYGSLGQPQYLKQDHPRPGICRNVCLLSGADDGECHGSRSLDGSLFQSSKPRPDRRW